MREVISMAPAVALLAGLALSLVAVAASAQTGPGSTPSPPDDALRGRAYGGQTTSPPYGAVTGSGSSGGAGGAVTVPSPSGQISAGDCQRGWTPALGMSQEEFLNACQNR